jgi:hypothetical protein|tara:strand:- start:1312 stop:1569 length:258 start_codon:yes stop_codon:yes gene_type:complete
MNEAKKKAVLRRMKSAIKRNKRQEKIDALQNTNLWMGLEMKDDDPLNEDINRFISKFRRMYLSGRLMKFREWIDVMDDLLDDLDK